MGSKWGVTLGLAVVAVVGLTGGAYMAHKSHASAAACDSIRDYATRIGDVQSLGEHGSRYAVLGDSYSTGDLLDDRSDAWTYDAARSMRLDVVAQGGTGYVNAGFCGDGAFEDRAGSIPTADRTVIVEGGLNDVDTSADEVRGAARSLYSALGDRELVVVGPVDAPNVDGEAAVDRVLHQAADDAGATYVSALGWDVEFGADGKHLTANGHAAYAELVTSALQRSQS